jgi:hypothetical protein
VANPFTLGVCHAGGLECTLGANSSRRLLWNTTMNGDRIVDVVELEAFRAMLAPFGRITWTALL